MNISIGSILAFLIILFSINVSLVGMGLVDNTWSNKISVLDSTPSTLVTNYNSNDLNVTSGQEIEGGTDSTTDSEQISGIPYKTGIFSRSQRIITLLEGLTIGYASIFIIMGLPTLIVWLLTGIIALLQFIATFYLLAYIFSILRGGGGI